MEYPGVMSLLRCHKKTLSSLSSSSCPPCAWLQRALAESKFWDLRGKEPTSSSNHLGFTLNQLDKSWITPFNAI